MTRAQHDVRERRGPSSTGPRIVVYGAIVANLAIALTKFVAAVANIEREIRLRYPKITRIDIETRSISEAATPASQDR